MLRGEIGEDDDDGLVDHVVVIGRWRGEEEALVVVHELDDLRYVQIGDLLGSEEERPAIQGPGDEGTDGSAAAEVLVRPGHEVLDPRGDGAKRISIGCREAARLPNVLEIAGEEEVCGLWCHGTSSLREPTASLRSVSAIEGSPARSVTPRKPDRRVGTSRPWKPWRVPWTAMNGALGRRGRRGYQVAGGMLTWLAARCFGKALQH